MIEPVDASTGAFDGAAIRVDSVRICGFRGIDELEVKLDPKLTVLVGRNNAGKSRVLRAIALAVGAVNADRDDFTSGKTAKPFIDIVIAPNNPDGSGRFDRRLGTILASPSRQTISLEPMQERVSWRTTIRQSAEGFSARADRQFLRWDATKGSWGSPSGDVASGVMHLCRAHLIESNRDLAAELRQRGSAAQRLVDDLEIDPAAIVELQAKLDELSSAIVTGSQTLRGIKDALSDLSTNIDAIGKPDVRAVPGRVQDLSTVASIELMGHTGTPLPLHLHGTGARSMTSLRLQSVLYERRLGADGGDLKPHPLSLIEEPEAHLHPQAQFDLPQLLWSIPGQVIVSTHSAHLVSEFDPEHLRILIPKQSGATVTTLQVVDEPPAGTPRQLCREHYRDEMEKLRRCVERPFGELFFASAVVIGDGATERSLLPVVLRRALGPLAQGICVIDPGSMNNAATVAVVKFARLVNIPWFLFADGDASGLKAVTGVLTSIAPEAEHAQLRSDCVVLIPDGATEKMFVDFDFDGSICEKAFKSLGTSEEIPPDIDWDVQLRRFKGSIGRHLGMSLIDKYPIVSDWPQPLQDLVTLVRAKLTTKPQGEPTEGDDGNPTQ